MGCQHGDCRSPLQSSLEDYVGMNGSTFSFFITPEEGGEGGGGG